jgi:hypothetical protein
MAFLHRLEGNHQAHRKANKATIDANRAANADQYAADARERRRRERARVNGEDEDET